MLIDWFTVAAQLVNFLILMWLMKRFLYKPILHAIDERERRIAKELSDADQKKSGAQKEGDEFRHKNEVFDQERAALLSKATGEAQAERERLLTEAKKAADALNAKQQEALRSDEQRIYGAIRLRTQSEVFSVARKTLKDLAGADLEERIVEAFIRRLHELTGAEKDSFASAFKASPAPVVVHSTFKLSPALSASIEGTIKAMLGANAEIQIETAPELISGIELVANGRKVAWSIAEYLTTLEDAVSEILKAKEKPELKSEAEPEKKVESKAEEPKPAPVNP